MSKIASAVIVALNRKSRFLLLSVIFAVIVTSLSGQSLQIRFPKSRESVYKLLSRISDQSGYLFIYDSEIIDNRRVVKIKPGSYSFEEAVKLAVANDEIAVKTEGKHALLYKKEELIISTLPLSDNINKSKDSVKTSVDSILFFTVEATLTDKLTGEPVVFATISVQSSSIGTVSNLNGHFKMQLPDSLENRSIRISHLGYQSVEIPLSMLAGQNITYSLNQKVVPLQEVVIRVVDPLKTVKDMIAKRALNYAHDPVMLTIFYREGVEFGKNINLTEAVLQIYKTGYRNPVSSEQVKLLKMRKVSNHGVRDTLMAKVKSSIYSFQQLDIVKNLPDFLDPDYIQLYDFRHTDITSIDGRRVLVICFRQKPEIYDALYEGELYIDAESYALIRAKFSLNTEFIKKAADIFVVKKDRMLDVAPESVSYDVDYKLYNGTYYINHIRGDLNFKIRKRWRMFSSKLKVWFETVNCNTYTGNTPTPSEPGISGLKQIPPSERISPREILSETTFVYDPDFWGNLNVIMPEYQIIDLIKSKLK